MLFTTVYSKFAKKIIHFLWRECGLVKIMAEHNRGDLVVNVFRSSAVNNLFVLTWFSHNRVRGFNLLSCPRPTLRLLHHTLELCTRLCGLLRAKHRVLHSIPHLHSHGGAAADVGR